jgi:hypothetical protein
MTKDQKVRRGRAPQAQYANFFQVGHNALEFVLDLGQFEPDSACCRLHTRIVTGPVYAKIFAEMLQNSVQRFESEHGEIHCTDDDLDPLEVVKGSIADFDRLGSVWRRRSAK